MATVHNNTFFGQRPQTTKHQAKDDGETTSGRKSGAGKTTALWNEVQSSDKDETNKPLLEDRRVTDR